MLTKKTADERDDRSVLQERSARHTLRQQLAAAEEAHTTQELRVTEWQAPGCSPAKRFGAPPESGGGSVKVGS